MGVDHVDVAERWSNAFTEAVSGEGALDRVVPSCPGWTVGDLVEHLAEVQAWWMLVLQARGALPDEGVAQIAARTGEDRVAGWREISARYVATQRETSPDTGVWCWWNDARRDTAAGIAWRQAHEAVVHCWDAQNAVGTAEPIDADVAADGVDEFVARYLNGAEWSQASAVVEFRAVDVGGRWSISTEGGKPHLVDGGTADCVVSGRAEQLYLLLWRRLPLDGLGVKGDRSVAAALVTWSDLS
jgi:uncharacterized protein (TIGR03083 family)